MEPGLRRALHNLGALTDLGAEVSSTHQFGEVTRASLYTLLGTLAVSKGAIARFSSEPPQLKIVAAKGLNDAVGKKIALAPDEAERLKTRGKPFRLNAEPDDLARFIRCNEEILKGLRASLCVPMVARGELVGVVFLAAKFTGEEFSDEDLMIAAAIGRHIAIAFFNHRLLVSLKRRAEENRRLYREMRRMYQDTVKAFGAAIDLKDSYTKGHSDRVARYSEAIAREMGISGSSLEYIGVAGYLHDVGKIVVDRSIINNPRPLSDREFRELNKHVETGYEILSNISHPWQEIAYLTRCHHEKVDGSGYPNGLRGDQIPLGAKIVTLADSFDAMMTDRPYRSRLTIDQSLAEVRRQAGKHFATEVVVAFCRLLLKEINGTARERVFVPMIGRRFDRPSITALLASMIEELACE